MKQKLVSALGLIGIWALMLFGIGLVSHAQEGVNSVISQGPPIVPYQKLIFYNGSNAVTYVCTANSRSPQTYFTITAATAANPGVFTSTAHGFSIYSKPRVTIIGTMPTGWTAVAGQWILSPVDANTFQLLSPTTGTALNTTGFTPAWSGTAQGQTTAPRTNQPYWAIQWLQYDGSGNLVHTSNAYGSSGSGASGLVGVKCDDRASGYVEYK